MMEPWTLTVHSKRWLVDRVTIRQARAIDLRYCNDEVNLDYLSIFFANGVSPSILHS
jgi:cyclin C